LSLDQFGSLVLRDNWKHLNLRQIDLTMGQKWMQKEIQKTFGINGGYTNLDLRRKTSNGCRPHVQADFMRTPFRDQAFDLILYDPPFLVDRRSISGRDYRIRHFSHYRAERKTGPQGYEGQKFGYWTSSDGLSKSLHRAFTEIKRILSPTGFCIFKWADSDKTLKFALSRKNGLIVERIWKRKSRGGKHTTTYYVWLKKPVIRGGE